MFSIDFKSEGTVIIRAWKHRNPIKRIHFKNSMYSEQCTGTYMYIVYGFEI